MSTLIALDMLAGAHWEVARAPPADNKAYCSKEDTRVDGPWESGTLQECSSQGQRTDLIEARDSLKNGKKFMDLVEDDKMIDIAARFPRFVERLEKEYNKPPAREEVYVTLHFGPANSGKSYCACKENPADPAIYWFDGNNGEFWEGYTGQKIVVMDEFSGSTLSPLRFQRVCDKYPMIVPIKGSSTPLLATEIHITSNYLPSKWWKEGTRYTPEAVDRRIHEVHWHRTPKDYEDIWVFTSNDDRTAMDQFMEFYVRENFVRID